MAKQSKKVQNQQTHDIGDATREQDIAFADLFRKGQPLLGVLPQLLKDQTTGKNIVWATETYEAYGAYYHFDHQMFPDFNINLIMDGILLPRIQKTKEQQKSRTKARAEVFTPSWICNHMNNFCDEQWFGREAVFNTEHDDHSWTPTEGNIQFGEQKNKRFEEWQRYVDSRRIEITCGEAPYIVSRYDATTGEHLPIKMRIGILDRKLRVVNENTTEEDDWFKWAKHAYEATYGFEYQGDNLFFARSNLVQTFVDYYKDRFGKEPSLKKVKSIAEIVSWNLWQMDGLKDTVPVPFPQEDFEQMTLDSFEEQPHIYCKVRDWRGREIIEYKDMKRER